MPVIVQKYGGTSVGTHDRLLRVARRVAALRGAGNDVVVVVSARGGTTDSLVEQARAFTRKPAQRELDMLMTAGERISMSLLAIALNSLDCPAVSFTGSQVGIITDTRHTEARILEVRPHRVRLELERGNVVVVGGFQGVSTAKDVTTLGRGGSDTTAVALAAALGAERCEILTDVDAVHTADPREVPEARRIDELSYEDMAELARFGATVLKESAVAFAERSGIEIHVGSSDSDTPGTIVLSTPSDGDPPITGISLLRGAVFLTGDSSEVHRSLRGLEADGWTVRMTVSTESGAAAAAEEPTAAGPASVADGVEARPAHIVAVVGREAVTAETAARCRSALLDTGTRLLAATASGRTALHVVPPEDSGDLVRRFHRELFETRGLD